MFKNGRPEGLDHILERLTGEGITVREVPHSETSSDIFIGGILEDLLGFKIFPAIRAFNKDLEPTVGEAWPVNPSITGMGPAPSILAQKINGRKL